MTVTIAATKAMIRPFTRGSKYEPWIGNNCQLTLLVAWNRATPNTLLPVLL